ncbi:hypothetical protein N2152v2_003147 [Parachlorella kessleri]
MDGGGVRRGGPDSRDRSIGRRGFRGTEENAKTKICMRWLAGSCTYAERCNFAHGEEELRQLPPRSPSAGGGRGRGRGGRGGYDVNMGYREGPGPQYSTGGAGRGQGSFSGGRGGPRPYENGGSGAGIGGGGGGSRPPRDHDAWVASGKPVSGPEGWTQYETPDTGEKYYHNQQTGVTTWEKPTCWAD